MDPPDPFPHDDLGRAVAKVEKDHLYGFVVVSGVCREDEKQATLISHLQEVSLNKVTLAIGESVHRHAVGKE